MLLKLILRTTIKPISAMQSHGFRVTYWMGSKFCVTNSYSARCLQVPKNKKRLLTSNKCIQSSYNQYSNNATPDQEPRPSLFFMQNPFTWLITKLDFYMLRKTWDPSFNEQDFHAGTKQAVCTITQLLAENKFALLEDLMSKRALEEIRHTLETSWSDEQRRNMALQDLDIQVAVPRKVHFKKEKNRKLCDVDMVFLAVKPAVHSAPKAVILIEVNARFHREYSDFSTPEWTVVTFKMPRFKLINTNKD